MSEAYHGEFVLPGSSATVFAYLTESALLAEWWPDGAETEPITGGRFHLWWTGPGWHLRGEYSLVEQPSRLTFTWKWDHEDLPARRVDMRLAIESSGSTLLTIEHDADSDDERRSIQEGWEFFIPQLRESLTAAS